MKLYSIKTWACYIAVCSITSLIVETAIKVATKTEDWLVLGIDVAVYLTLYTIGYLVFWPLVQDPKAATRKIRGFFRRKKVATGLAPHRKFLLEQCLMTPNTPVYRHEDRGDTLYLLHNAKTEEGFGIMEEIGTCKALPYALLTFLPSKERLAGTYLEQGSGVLVAYEGDLGFTGDATLFHGRTKLIEFVGKDADWIPIDEAFPVDSLKYLLNVARSFVEKYQYILTRAELDLYAKVIFKAESPNLDQDEIHLILSGNVTDANYDFWCSHTRSLCERQREYEEENAF